MELPNLDKQARSVDPQGGVVDDLAQLNVVPQHVGQHLRVERRQESVSPCKFVFGHHSNWNELRIGKRSNARSSSGESSAP